jgi:hypothetical protein
VVSEDGRPRTLFLFRDLWRGDESHCPLTDAVTFSPWGYRGGGCDHQIIIIRDTDADCRIRYSDREHNRHVVRRGRRRTPVVGFCVGVAERTNSAKTFRRLPWVPLAGAVLIESVGLATRRNHRDWKPKPHAGLAFASSSTKSGWIGIGRIVDTVLAACSSLDNLVGA